MWPLSDHRPRRRAVTARAVTLLLDALAAYRLTRLATADVIGQRPRAWFVRSAYRRAGVRLPRPNPGETIVEAAVDDPCAPKLATLATCRWCAGFWVSALVVVARRLVPRAWDPLARALSLSAAAALLARLEDE